MDPDRHVRGVLHVGRQTITTIVVVTCLAATIVFGVEPGFYPLGDLPRAAFWSEAYGVSPDGTIVVGMGDVQLSNPNIPIAEAFRTDGVSPMQGLGDLAGGMFRSMAFASSTGGEVIVGVGTITDNKGRACVWRNGQPGEALPVLPGCLYGAHAQDVTPDGRVIVGTSHSGQGAQAFRWAAETGTQPLGDLPGDDFHSEAYAVSANGSIVVGVGASPDSSAGQEAFVWRESTQHMEGLGFLSDTVRWSAAYDITPDGRVVVGVSEAVTGGVEGFYWTQESGMVGIGFTAPEYNRSTADAVSADGRVIVGTTLRDNRLIDAAVWTPEEGLRHLATTLEQDFAFDMTGWRLIEAVGVSDDGLTIVGKATDASNKPQAYMVRLPVGTWCHEPVADIDGDRDVDQEDFGYIQRCLTGPADPDTMFNRSICRCIDFDDDDDIDQDDLGIFERCISGANVPANPGCAD